MQGHREKALGRADTAETAGAVTRAPHARAVQAVCAVSSGHRELGPDSGSSQGGREEDGWQPVSSLATATHQPRGLGPAPLRKQPALPYSGRVRRGRLFLRAEREGTLHPKAEKRNVPAGRQAGFRGQELAGLGFAPRGGGCSQASRAGAPAAAVLPTRSWRGGQEPAVSTLGTGEGRKKEEALR